MPGQPARPRFDPGSFRDPAGRVFRHDGRIFRTVDESAAAEFDWIVRSGVLEKLSGSGQLVRTWPVDAAEAGFAGPSAKILESEVVPFISYPYEWPFAALKRAALFHLDLHLALLDHGATLSDASAYNVQFIGTRPVFIDVLSLRRYREGAIWSGHRQFCEQFLNPLLLRARLGIAYNAWYRGALEGIPSAELAPLLRLRDRLSWQILLHVVLPQRLQTIAGARPRSASSRLARGALPRQALVRMLEGLRNFIARLAAPSAAGSPWLTYADDNSYSEHEGARKRSFVAAFAAAARPRRVLDLGCNTGDYADVLLGAGAGMVIGAEADPATADAAFARSEARGLCFLPLVVDAANPSAAQGWDGAERAGFAARGAFDAVVALAFEHHLAIGRNVPLDALLDWLVSLAPRGVVEFVPKDDPTVKRMLELRADIFGDYAQDRFEALLRERASIVREERISAGGRMLYWFERTPVHAAQNP